jgi:hypothetical protein
MSAERDIKSIINKILKTFNETAKVAVLKDLAEFTIDMIVKRTRLGYGVSRVRGSNSTKAEGIEKVKLKPLSPGYVLQRKKSRRLSNLTTAKKSNLTFTGQMLKSMGIIKIKQGQVVIGPSGSRDDGRTNQEIAGYVTEQGRPFNDLYGLEQDKLTRYFRSTYGDILRKQKLLKY